MSLHSYMSSSNRCSKMCILVHVIRMLSISQLFVATTISCHINAKYTYRMNKTLFCLPLACRRCCLQTTQIDRDDERRGGDTFLMMTGDLRKHGGVGSPRAPCWDTSVMTGDLRKCRGVGSPGTPSFFVPV